MRLSGNSVAGGETKMDHKPLTWRNFVSEGGAHPSANAC
jgi:hypothetical protein